VRRLLTVALAAALLLLGACGSDTGGGLRPGGADIDVDTAALRQAKQDAGVEPCRPQPGDPVEGGLPDVTLPCFAGGEDVDLAGLRGPLVINLWGSWCGPCRKEMPVLQQFHERYADRVPVLGIDFVDPQTGSAMDLVRKSGVTYPLLADPQGDLQGDAPFPARMGLPLFAFVDEEGHVELAAGGVGSVDDLVDLVDEHLGVRL
jgi:thiol-disulfide isomerase/thioredoxin